eukprot:NODE_3599_length_755_cov_35.028329_g3018_i0.p1 GENE.NODE_3599_length_755_cov_35.028329_g3018_i0~~NODE_3599_length_755_cov_35.028329_g3018_i0.p1  ORF type:complete len:184 (-),score=89.91 NODE_3599_length_755_cov_35.028329_g3018_i0:202-732(-)
MGVELTPQMVKESIKDESQVDESPSTEQEQKSVDLTAFALASKLVMGSLSPLITKDQFHVRRNTQFMASGSVEVLMSRITTELEKLNASPQQAKSGNTIKCFINTPNKGLVTFAFVIFTTVCKDLVLVEGRRMRGDTLEFQKFYREIVRLLVDLVPNQPPQEELMDYESSNCESSS